MTTSGTFASTFIPSSQWTSLTVPEMGAATSFCIFIASKISMVCPSWTKSPTVTSTVTTLPGMLALTVPLRFRPPPEPRLRGAAPLASGSMNSNVRPSMVAR